MRGVRQCASNSQTEPKTMDSNFATLQIDLNNCKYKFLLSLHCLIGGTAAATANAVPNQRKYVHPLKNNLLPFTMNVVSKAYAKSLPIAGHIGSPHRTSFFSPRKAH